MYCLYIYLYILLMLTPFIFKIQLGKIITRFEWGAQVLYLLQNKKCLRLLSTPAANWHGKAHIQPGMLPGPWQWPNHVWELFGRVLVAAQPKQYEGPLQQFNSTDDCITLPGNVSWHCLVYCCRHSQEDLLFQTVFCLSSHRYLCSRMVQTAYWRTFAKTKKLVLAFRLFF